MEDEGIFISNSLLEEVRKKERYIDKLKFEYNFNENNIVQVKKKFNYNQTKEILEEYKKNILNKFSEGLKYWN